jgi:hypothetical protein
VGALGTATAGDSGTATAGLYGVISIIYYDNRADAYRRKAGEINPMLQRLFQTFVMGAQDR